MRPFLLLLFVLLFIALPAQASKIKTTTDLVTAMQQKYGKSWYRTATFVQKTTNYDKEGKQTVLTWFEALSVPGSLRIDFTPVKDGDGILFTDRKVFSFKDGKQESSREYVHPLMILGFDIYRLPLTEVMTTLKDLKFNLSIFRRDTW